MFSIISHPQLKKHGLGINEIFYIPSHFSKQDTQWCNTMLIFVADKILGTLFCA